MTGEPWIFPEVNLNAIDSGESKEKKLSKKKALMMQLATQEKQMSERIAILDELIDKLKRPTHLLDEEIVEMIVDIIKKTVKSLIYKELDVDKTIVVNLINELKNLMPRENNAVQVMVSEQDYQRLGADNLTAMGVSCNTELKRGDVLIKSNFTEVRAILNERIDQLLSVQHE